MPDSDTELLETFARTRDERAFEMLVARHLGLVLGAARRRLGGREALAEEVAQNVFVTLARRSSALRKHTCLPAWLQKTAAFEAMRAARKEGNHVKKIHRFKDEVEVQLDGADRSDGDMKEALPILDEAMASLGEGDRRALMWRFYEDKSFKRIAVLTGKSEAACQKQARRAVDKLGELLRHRGVVIPATVLASALTVELAKAAPAGAAPASIASTAVASSAAISISVLQHITIMKTKTAVAAGAAVLIACAGTGYVAGKVSAPRGSVLSSPVEIDDPPGENVSGKTAGAAADGKTAVEMRSLLAKLLDLARGELALAKYDIASDAHARARLARIPLDQIPVALAMIAAMPGGFDGQAELTDALLTEWARKDGRAACDFSLENRKPQSMGLPPIGPVLTAWAEVDPQAALDWYLLQSEAKHPGLNEKDFGRWKAISNIRWIMAAWIHRDMDGAIAAYKRLDEEAHRGGAITAFSEHAARVQGREKLLDLYKELPKELRQMTIGGALDKWSFDRPEKLAKWVDENPVEGVHHTYLPPRVLRNWLVSDSEAAIDWWFRRPHEYDRESQVRQLMRHWADMDPFAAGEWLAAQELDESYDGAIMDFSGKIADRDPERALAWALAIGGEWGRDRALEEVAKKWGKKDVAAAREKISAADIPEEQKAKLLEAIDAK